MPETDEQRYIAVTPFHRFLLAYGIFLSSWNSFEALLEVLIRRELRLTIEETCIVTAGLGFGAKVSILVALLNRTDAGKAGAALILEAQRIAERNNFAHSFLSVDKHRRLFTQIRRETKAALSVRLKQFSAEMMEKHKDDFFSKWTAIQTHFNVTDAQLNQYQRTIESYAPAPAIQEVPPLESPTNSRASRPQRRAERRIQKRTPKDELA